MRVLFVSSGNTGDVGVLVKNQADSLIKEGVDIDFYLIKGKGFWGYLRSIKGIRHKFLNGNYDLIHAHYSLSAFAASLAGRFPLVVSLMGSDAYLSGFMRFLARLFYTISWDVTIVKTQRMKDMLRMGKAVVIPNGVDIDKYRVVPKVIAREKIGYNKQSKLIVFVADPSRSEKNYELAKLAFEYCKECNAELLTVYNKPNDIIPYYLNAADVLLLTSKWEGSVNVVKEAMACNLPIVSTDVGDVKINTTGVKHTFICESSPQSLAEGILHALRNTERTNGREVLLEKQLDSFAVAKNIIELYETVKKT
jgi:glycosyltransferase involved in cell wall biosynthesis